MLLLHCSLVAFAVTSLIILQIFLEFILILFMDCAFNIPVVTWRRLGLILCFFLDFRNLFFDLNTVIVVSSQDIIICFLTREKMPNQCTLSRMFRVFNWDWYFLERLLDSSRLLGNFTLSCMKI